MACSSAGVSATAPTAGEALTEIPYYQEGGSDDESMDRLESDRPGFLVRAYRQSGPVFRTCVGGEPTVILAGPEANDFVWRSTDLWDYPLMFPGFREQLGPDHLNNLEGEAHRQKRGVLKGAFDQGPAMRYLPEFNRRFHAKLADAAEREPLDLIRFWAETIVEANTHTVVQANVSERALKRLVRWESEMLEGISLGEGRHAFYGREEYAQLREGALALMGAIVDERLAHPDRHDDNFAAVLRSRRQPSGDYPPRHCLIDDLYYIIVAGVENTSRLINWTALQVAFSPEWQERLRAEVDAWDGEEIAALGAMPVLKAVIMETQRLRPPVFFTRRHSKREFEFAGIRVPAHTHVFSANTLCHFLEEIYPEPLAFKPERFLDGGRFVPRSNGFFGGGVHLCLGRNHSLMQTPLALAQIFKYHDLHYVDELELRDIVAAPGRPMPDEIRAEIAPRAV